MAVTRINNNQISDASAGNSFVGINAAVKLQNYSITSQKIANNLTYGSDLTIAGNLTVQGNTTAIDTTYTTVEDPVILLASGQTGSPTVDIGFIGQRGTSENIAMVWDESASEFVTAFTTTGETNTTVSIASYTSFHTGNANIGGNMVVNGTSSFVGNVVGNVTFTGNVGLASISTSGNITGGNVLTGGLVSATGNITSSANIAGGNLLATTTVSAASHIGSVVSVSGDITGGNLLTNGTVYAGAATATGNITGGNILSNALVQGTTVSASGNVIGGNVTTAGLVSATGNITSAANVAGGNLLATTTVSAASHIGSVVSVSGNVTGGNINTAGNVSTAGNVIGGNVLSAGLVQGVTGYFTGNVDVLGNLNATVGVVYANSGIFYGNSITGVGAAFAGVPGFTALGSNVIMQFAGNVNSYAQLNFENISTGTLASTDYVATADNGNDSTFFVDLGIAGSNHTDPAFFGDSTSRNDAYLYVVANGVTSGSTARGNLIVGSTNGNIKFFIGNTAQANVIQTVSSLGVEVTGIVSATGNVTGGNLVTGGVVSSTGNVSGGNINATSAVTAATVSASGNITGGNLITAGAISATGGVSTTGNLTVGNVTATGAVSGATISSTGNLFVGGNLTVQGNITYQNVDDLRVEDPIIIMGTGPNGTPLSQDDGMDRGIYMEYYKSGAVGNAFVGWDNSSGNMLAASSVNFSANNVVNVLAYGTFQTGNIFAQSAVSTGNVTAGNLLTAGLVSATGNITSAANIAGGNLLATTTVSAASHIGSVVSVSGNITSAANIAGGNLLATTTVSAVSLLGTTVSVSGNVTGGAASLSGNITGGNVLTGGLVSSTGNITSSGNIAGGNLIATTNVSAAGVSASGNITGGNVLTGGLVSSTGNITSAANIAGGNLLATTTVSAASHIGSVVSVSANITGGNLITGGVISATGNISTAGNITASYYFGNGSQLTGINATTSGFPITAGTSNIAAATNGNIGVTVAGTSNVVTFASTGQFTTGLVSATGNISSSANISGGNVLATTIVSGASVLGSVVSASGNITGANINTGGANGLTLNASTINSNAGRITINSADADVDFAVDGLSSGNVFYVDAGTKTASFGSSTQTTNAIVAMNATNSFLMPVGNTPQRPDVGVTGMLRFNSTLNAVEVYDNSAWATVGTPSFTVISDQQFNGDGSTVAFTLSASATTNSVIVSINGVIQIPTLAYSVSSTTLTFTEAPQSGDVIDVRNITTTTSVTSISNSPGNAVVATNATQAIVEITGNLNPTANVTYSLGNTTARWKDLWLAGNSLYMGNIIMKNTTGNTVAFYGADGTTPASIDSSFSSTGNIVGGNLISTGTITTAGNIVSSGSNGVANIGSATTYFNTVHAKATSAQYADLAENYTADAHYEPGTVVSFGGSEEVTVSSISGDRKIAGVVSTNPSYVMNATLEGAHVVTIALTGRVPTKVSGPVAKGDMMVSGGNGRAIACAAPAMGTVIGKALQNHTDGDGVIEVVVGRL